MKREVIFDLETEKLFNEIETDNPADLGVSIVSLYIRQIDEDLKEIEGKIKSFWKNQFDSMWQYFQEADRIIGFNSLGFDVPVLAPHANFPFGKLPHFDIMDEFKRVEGRRISLDALARETLDVQKTDHGLNAVHYWKKHDKESLQKLQKYCEDDVIITKDLYHHALTKGELLYKDKWNTLRKVEVDFSYPEEESDDQIGLF